MQFIVAANRFTCRFVVRSRDPFLASGYEKSQVSL